MRVILIALAISNLLADCAAARDGHHLFHAFYQDWQNRNRVGCCNDRDCGPLAETDVRTQRGELQIYVRGVGAAAGKAEWCPVLSHHYLSRGNAPNGATAHACVSDFYGATTPCAQFICFQPSALY